MSVEHPPCAMHYSKYLDSLVNKRDQERNIPAPINLMFYPGKIESE